MKINITKFQSLVDSGYINKKSKLFPRGELIIWNYSAQTQYEGFWTEETLMARGLITTENGEIIARPFPKFFNVDEHIQKIGPLPIEKFSVYEKYDGSLGILFFDGEQFRFSTRGSFTSDQAIEANSMLKKYNQKQFNSDYILNSKNNFDFLIFKNSLLLKH